MRDHQRGRAARPTQLFQEIDHTGGRFPVKGSRGFVRQNDIGAADQGAADRHALLLSARQVRRQIIQPVRKPQIRSW